MKDSRKEMYGLLVGATALLGAACSEGTSALDAASNLSASALSAAFATAPVGYGDLASSYVASTASDFSDAALWVGGGREASFSRGSLMGGGLGDAFVGGIGFGRGFGHLGPFGGALRCASSATATFNASTGGVECPAETRNGLTVTRSAAYATAAGAVQQAFDTLTTNSVNLRTAVTGTASYSRAADSASADSAGRGGKGGRGWGHGRGSLGRLLGDTATILTATSTVGSASERTVTGLAQGSTQRTVNGASRGTESTTGTSSRGAFTATRTVGDTTRGVVVPVRAAGDTTRTYPTAGTVIRVINASLTYSGQAATTLSRREVVTYNGTATATVTITENGTTRTCTRSLTSRGQLVCP
jgi:hypothetical protein